MNTSFSLWDSCVEINTMWRFDLGGTNSLIRDYLYKALLPDVLKYEKIPYTVIFGFQVTFEAFSEVGCMVW